ncbi:hypothetical protein C0583_07065 [Candidatus Parcubacteria bacterium]|nr:MAG: hypothetical protein C0583_07065 [Candidatus Parcubacteria bacterium]
MKQAIRKTANNYKQALPIMLSMLLLVNLLNPMLEMYYPKVFSGNFVIDPLIGAILGSISFGMPIISYIIGGELLRIGISLLAVTAFILTWTTVGVAMLPLEAKFLGKRFAIVRNLLNFVFSILIAILTVFLLSYV